MAKTRMPGPSDIQMRVDRALRTVPWKSTAQKSLAGISSMPVGREVEAELEEKPNYRGIWVLAGAAGALFLFWYIKKLKFGVGAGTGGSSNGVAPYSSPVQQQQQLPQVSVQPTEADLVFYIHNESINYKGQVMSEADFRESIVAMINLGYKPIVMFNTGTISSGYRNDIKKILAPFMGSVRIQEN